MAALNPLTRELVFKIVYYGPGLGGKTTSLQWVHENSKPEHRGRLVSLATPTDRTLYFDFLPIRVPKVRTMSVRLQLFTVPGQVYFSATRKLVLTGADGVVFVADSQPGRMDANQESLEDLNNNLAEHGKSLSQTPHTFQWNKRDVPDVVAEDELDRRFNLFASPSTPTVATNGVGVFEGLEKITRVVVDAYRAELPRGDKAVMPGLIDAEELGIAEAIRGLAESPGPRRSPMIGRKSPSAPALPAQQTQEGTSPSTERSSSRVKGQELAQTPTATPPSSRMPSPLKLDSSPAPVPPASSAPLGRPSQGHTQETVTPQSPTSFTMSELWPEAERGAARKVEGFLSAGDFPDAVGACEALVTRVLASAASLAGSADAPRDPVLVVLLLGLEGRRYLEFRRLVRAARGAGEVTAKDAYVGYLFALELRRARDGIER